MKQTLVFFFAAAIFFASSVASQAELIINQDFEAETVPEGPNPKWYQHGGDHFIGIASEEDYPIAGGASKGSESAIVITGGDDAPQGWQPAVDFVLPALEGGYLKIAFKIRNGSLGSATCLFQIWGSAGEEQESLYQSLWFDSGFVRASGTDRYMFKEVTLGESSDWHEVVWTIPLPGTEGVASLEIDGDSQGEFVESPPEGFVQLNRFRFFLQGNRASDVQFAIDDLVIERVKKP